MFNLLGVQVIFHHPEQQQVHHYYDFISSDEKHDAYMTICCISWLLNYVRNFMLWLFPVLILKQLKVTIIPSLCNVLMWSDNCHHFKADLFLSHIKTFCTAKSMAFTTNYLEAGDGKNNLDRHFGKLKGIEARYLLRFDEIIGL